MSNKNKENEKRGSLNIIWEIEEEELIWKSKTKDDELHFKSMFAQTDFDVNGKIQSKYICKINGCNENNEFTSCKQYNFNRHLIRYHKDWTLNYIRKSWMKDNEDENTNRSLSIFHDKRKLSFSYYLSQDDFNQKILELVLTGIPLKFFNETAIKFFLDPLFVEFNNCKLNSVNI